jgi:hypothetical protein
MNESSLKFWCGNRAFLNGDPVYILSGVMSGGNWNRKKETNQDREQLQWCINAGAR